MEKTSSKVIAIGSSALLLASGAAGLAITTQNGQVANAAEEPPAEAPVQKISEGELCRVCAVHGTFTFSQGVVSTVEDLAKNLAGASKYLCGNGAVDAAAPVSPDEWTISVTGDVENSYSATLSEMADEGAAQITMGCSCAGNPVDGRAAGNAEVFGATVSSIIEKAQPAESVNTVVFTSSDGYEVTVPLFYVVQRFSVIAFDINGEPIGNTMGGSNQLWLGSTAASYFAQDVSEIRFESRQTPPSTPGTVEAGDSTATPNVSLTAANAE